jgi:two-component system alkaline phosphatase synthesis response regulator PhoP
MSLRILLVEDEPGLQMTVADLLVAEGYEVDTASDGLSGLAKASTASSRKYDLIILDVMLPGKSGFDVCRDLRQMGSDVAILMLTARGHVADRVIGLKLGADDYISKPFDPQELLARVEALLRRVTKENLTPVVKYQFGKVQVDFQKSEVQRDGQPVSLAGKEMQLLRYLIDHRGNALTREDILSQVWEYQPSVSTRTVDVHIAWLRQKLEENPQFPKFILTVRGLGYRFAA